MFYTLSIGFIIVISIILSPIRIQQPCSSYLTEPPPKLTKVNHHIHITVCLLQRFCASKVIAFLHIHKLFVRKVWEYDKNRVSPIIILGRATRKIGWTHYKKWVYPIIENTIMRVSMRLLQTIIDPARNYWSLGGNRRETKLQHSPSPTAGSSRWEGLFSWIHHTCSTLPYWEKSKNRRFHRKLPISLPDSSRPINRESHSARAIAWFCHPNLHWGPTGGWTSRSVRRMPTCRYITPLR